MSPRNHGWGVYIETRPSKDVLWDDAEVEPYDFFCSKKEATIAKKMISKTPLKRVIIEPEP